MREGGSWRNYDDHIVSIDTVVIDPAGPLSPGVVLRGTLRHQGFAPVSNYSRPRKTHIVEGAFAATFDPRVDSVPQAMPTGLATRILKGALYEFAVGWMGGMVNPSPADSTRDNSKARAFLTSRWGEAAIIDSVAVAEKTFYVRMHARYAPVTCVVTHDSSAPSCTAPRKAHWWSRSTE